MLEPALVLESSMTVAEALAELDRYANFSCIAIRRAAPDGRAQWFAMRIHALRWLLQDSGSGETLEVVLELDTTPPANVRDIATLRDSDAFDGIVLDGDEIVGVGVEETVMGTFRGGAPPAPPRAPAPAPPPAAQVRRPAAAEAPGAAPQPTPDNAVVVPVLFATDRAMSGPPSAAVFGSERGPLTWGVATVSIPKDHEEGELESPVWWKFEFRPNPQKHVTLVGVTTSPREDFVTLARDAVRAASRHEVLVFVHGYNVSFANAARRTAQIAYDLRFAGLPMFYSWPSTGGTMRYFEDETNARWTVPHFGEFLSVVQTELGATAIHVIAHSMGNRVLTECLRSHRVESGAPLRQLVLAAPDVDADTFADLAVEFHAQAERVTLYASSRDLALKASKLVHGYPRAGDSEPQLVLADGVDTIDASRVDTNLLGHSYVGDARSILGDVHALLASGQSPPERPSHLEARDQQGKRYWCFST